MKKRITAILALSALILSGAASAGQSAESKFTPLEPTMPVSQVKTGMRAKVKTVLEGTEIYQFDATLLGVIPRKGSPKNLILIRVDDKYVRDSGGIAAGMSGSPVYVNGKLVGAIGYGWAFGDSSLGLVTPIEEMVKAFDWPDKVPGFGVSPRIPAKMTEESADVKSEDVPVRDILSPDAESVPDEDVSDDIFAGTDGEEDGSSSADAGLEDLLKSISNDLSADIDIRSGDESSSALPARLRENMAKLYDMELTPLAAPLLVDGISPRVMDRLKRRLGVEVIPLGSSQESGAVNLKASPQPGSAIGASLAWGDFQAGGIGTLTALDKDGRFLAFGHPMVNRGAVAYAATEASIIKIIPSVASPFKLGYQGAIIGIVTQDRPEAIGGRLGRLAPATSYVLKYHDVDTGKKVTKRFQTVADPFVGPALGTAGMLGMIDDLWARIGEGTAILRYRFSGGRLVQGWTRGNIYLSDTDVVAELAAEFDELSKIFALNQFQEIRPFGVELEMEITGGMRVVSIEKLKIANEKDSYEPGETISLDVTLRPWRKRATVKRLSLKIPENAVGFCEVVVRGGGIDEPGQDSILAGYRALTGFGDLIKELNAAESNNQLILEIKSDGDLFAPGKSKKAKEDGDAKAGGETKEGRGKEKDVPSLEDFMDDRLKSEIIEERVNDGTMKIIDTNYYVDGLLRKMIMIGGKGGNGSVSRHAEESLEEVAGEKYPEPESGTGVNDENPGGQEDLAIFRSRPER